MILMYINIMNNHDLVQLLDNQLNEITNDYKMKYVDIKRLSAYLPGSIFTNECCIWKGSKTLVKNKLYCNFYLNKKKFVVQRILYENYIGKIKTNKYLHYTCDNPGICCSISHFSNI